MKVWHWIKHLTAAFLSLVSPGYTPAACFCGHHWATVGQQECSFYFRHKYLRIYQQCSRCGVRRVIEWTPDEGMPFNDWINLQTDAFPAGVVSLIPDTPEYRTPGM